MEEVRTKPTAVQAIDFKNTPPPKLQTLPPYLVNLSESKKDLPYLLYYKGVGMFPRGNIQTLLGERKSGKTTVARMFIAAMFKGQYLDFKTEDGTGLKILIADTEQAPYNVEQNTRRIHIAAGLNPHRNNPDLLVLQLRPYDKAERLRIVGEEITRFRPDFVLLDGIVDVCQDFNDAKESGKTITALLKLSADYDCAVLCVMHFNKDGETARGHLGAELQNKSTECYEVKRNGSRTEVKPMYCRDREIPPFAFEVDADGDSEQITLFSCAPTTKQDREKAELYDLMRQVFEDGEPRRHTDVQEAIRGILAKIDPKTKKEKPCSENTAKSRISKAVELKVIRKEESGLYSLWEDPSFEEIPTDELQDDEDPI